MRKAILFFMILPSFCFSQGRYYARPAAGGAVATDDFNRSDATLGANWTDFAVTNFFVSSNHAIFSEGGNNVAGSCYTAISFAAGQYAQAKVTFGTGVIGVLVRGTAAVNDGYYYFEDTGGATYMGYSNDGFGVDLGTGGSEISSGDIMRLEISGTTLTPKVNGTLQDPPGQQTDSAYSSGYPGLSGYGTTVTNMYCDDWEGGDL